MSLIDLIAAMFWSPDPHPDPYTWATVLLAHAAVGAVLAAVDNSAYQVDEVETLKDRLERAVNKIIATANEALLEIQNG